MYERNSVAYRPSPTGHLACNPGKCPDHELNLRPQFAGWRSIHWGTPARAVFILTCLNFSHFQSTLHVMRHSYQDTFSTAQNSFWTLQFWCCLVLLPFFVSPLPYRQNISLWGLSLSGETKRMFTRRKIRWIGRIGHESHAGFWQKTAEHSACCRQMCS